MFFLTYPQLQPSKSVRRYEPRIFGFKVHASAALARWQSHTREQMRERVYAEGLETGFEEEEDDEIEDEEEEEGQNADGIDEMFEGRASMVKQR
jgi:casein kinase II subunit beta